MKTKELTKQVRDNVVEMYRSGLAYKKISETLNIPLSTINPLLKNGKHMAQQQTCQERAVLQNSRTRQGGWALNREASKRPKITLMDLQSSTAETGVSVRRTTLRRTLHRAGLYRRVSRKKPLFKEENKQTHLVFAKRHVGDSPNI
jgi:transposase